eukprot:12812296-Heterocapsa_arctica.AAC.1
MEGVAGTFREHPVEVAGNPGEHTRTGRHLRAAWFRRIDRDTGDGYNAGVGIDESNNKFQINAGKEERVGMGR